MNAPMWMCRQRATLKRVNAVDDWQGDAGSNDIALDRIRIERGSGTSVKTNDIEVQPKGKLWYYVRDSYPHGLDIGDLKEAAEASGSGLSVVYENHTYSVTRADEYLDEYGKPFVWELELV